MAAPQTFSAALTTLSRLMAETSALAQKLEDALPAQLAAHQIMSMQNIDRITQRLADCQMLCDALAKAAPQAPVPENIFSGLKLGEIRDNFLPPPHQPETEEKDIEWF